jgi:hypothetical protein
MFHTEDGGPVRRHLFRREWYQACEQGRSRGSGSHGSANRRQLGLRGVPGHESVAARLEASAAPEIVTAAGPGRDWPASWWAVR